MGYGVLLLVAAIALAALVPTRRLFLAGWRQGVLAGYFVAIVALGILVAELRGPTKFLVPVLAVAWLLPFFTPRDGIARLLARRGQRRDDGDDLRGGGDDPRG